MAYGKISKIDCDAAFYDDCHCRRRRDVGDSRGGPRPRLTPKGLGWRSLESPRPSNVTGSIGGSDSRGRMLVSAYGGSGSDILPTPREPRAAESTLVDRHRSP